MGATLEGRTEDVGLGRRSLRRMEERWEGDPMGSGLRWLYCLATFSDQLMIPGSGHLLELVERFILEEFFSHLLPVSGEEAVLCSRETEHGRI